MKTLMKILFFLILANVAYGQTTLSIPDIQTKIDSNVYQNATRKITGEHLNFTLSDMAQSYVNRITDLQLLVPDQAGHAGQVLHTDGSVSSWSASGSGAPGGSNTQLQYNNSSVFGGVAGATSDGTNILIPNLFGGSSSAGDITFSSTSHATKHRIYLGSAQESYFDEVNKLLLIKATSSGSTDNLRIQNTSSSGQTNLTIVDHSGIRKFGVGFRNSGGSNGSLFQIAHWNTGHGISLDTAGRVCLGADLTTTVAAYPDPSYSTTAQSSDGLPLVLRRNDNTAGHGLDLAWKLQNSTPAYAQYGKITTFITTNTAGSESGEMRFFAVNAGALNASCSVTGTAFNLLPYGITSGLTAGLRFYELAANGSNYIEFKSPDALAANNAYVLPIAFGAAGTVLTDAAGNGVLSWSAGGGGGSGTVTSIATTSPITGGTITTTGTIGINNAAADGSTKGAASFTAADFNASSGNISIDYTNGQAADGSTKGFLTAADWTTFNGKGSGTVTNFSAGDFSPLFTTSEATTTSTPALTFAAVTQTANKVFASPVSGGAAAPTFRALVEADIPDLSASYYTIFNPDNYLNDATAGGLFARIGLSNLTSVSINTSLLAQTGVDLGSTVKPFRDLFLFGGGTYGTNYFKFTGTPTSTRTITIPDVTGTLSTLDATQAFTNKSYNGLTLTGTTGTFTLTNAKTFSVSNTLTLAGTDGSTLNVSTGGTLGSNAFTSTAYAPLASPTFTGTVVIPTPFTLGATSVTSTGTQLNYLSTATGTTGTNTTNIVYSTSPALTTPSLGVATATSVNKVTLTAPATGSTLTIDDGFTLHATGNVTALSGSSTGANTGDQTITLTGNVTGSGTGSFAATIANNAVTLAKMVQGSAHTFWANNTGSTANVAEVTYSDNNLATYVGTATWDGTPPATIISQQYGWEQVGSNTTLTLAISYTSAGTTNTTVSFTLPADCPTPVTIAGMGANASDVMYMGSGRLGTSLSQTPPACRCWLSKNAANNGYIITILAASLSAKTANFTVTYRTN